MAQATGGVPAVGFGPSLHRGAGAAGIRARQARELDRAAEGRHRQQARRFRIREDRRMISTAAYSGHLPLEGGGRRASPDASRVGVKLNHPTPRASRATLPLQGRGIAYGFERGIAPPRKMDSAD